METQALHECVLQLHYGFTKIQIGKVTQHVNALNLAKFDATKVFEAAFEV